jgi:hypothetical protein
MHLDMSRVEGLEKITQPVVSGILGGFCRVDRLNL